MEVNPVADIYGYGHSGCRLAQSHGLRFAQLGPVTLVRLSFAGAPVRKLHKVKRKVATPRASPIANHDRKECAVLIGTSRITLALVPNGASKRETNERSNHRVVK